MKSVNTVVVKDIAKKKVRIIQSRALSKDEFSAYYKEGDIIEPPYNPELLVRLPEQSDILQQCIDAYKTNIVGFGFDMKYDVDYDKMKPEEQKFIDSQWTKFENFFKYCSCDSSFTEIMKNACDDKERIGWGTLEVIEDTTGIPAGLVHVPAHKVRLCKKDDKAIEVQIMIADENDNQIKISVMKKFRRFVQIVNTEKVYFKEFGDPRTLNCHTGKYAGDGEAIAEEDIATSMIFFNIYSPYTEYGLPRYLGQLLNIQGNRKAEELNYTYFTEGRHMPMALLVENGKLTSDSLTALKESVGDAARHKFLVLQAEGDQKEVSLADDNKKSPVQIKLEPLVQMLQNDGLFQEYCKNNRDKIRSSFRLHPLYTGESQDYTRATADTARKVTEEQVFQPEREDLAFKLNNALKPALGIQGVSMTFAEPVLADNGEIATAIAPYVTAGAATPNMLLDALGQLLNKEFESFDGDWADKPLAITLKEMELNRSIQEQGQQTNDDVGTPDKPVVPTAPDADVEKADDRSDIVEGLKTLQGIIKEAIGYDE